MNQEYAEWFWPEVHHVWRKSQYKKDDRDEEWNLSLLYSECHKKIHNGDAWELDKRLKAEADIRKPPEERSKKKAHRKKIMYTGNMHKYDKQVARDMRVADIEYFKETHDWLTPSKYAYKQQKLYYNNLKNKDGKKR